MNLERSLPFCHPPPCVRLSIPKRDLMNLELGKTYLEMTGFLFQSLKGI